MRRSTQRTKAGRSRDFMRLAAVILFTAGILLFLIFFYTKDTSVSAKDSLSDVRYKVVEIKSGDSLWSVASDNMNPGFSDIYEYIDEIRRCNNLDTDQITSGCYLMIPYYE